MSDPEAYQITTIIITTIIINYRAINFADELWSAIKGEVLAHPPSPFEQKMKNQSNSDFQNQKSKIQSHEQCPSIAEKSFLSAL